MRKISLKEVKRGHLTYPQPDQQQRMCKYERRSPIILNYFTAIIPAVTHYVGGKLAVSTHLDSPPFTAANLINQYILFHMPFVSSTDYLLS